MHPKSIKELGSSRNFRIILQLFIFLILIVFLIWAQTPWIFFVIVFLFVTLFFTMFFWQQYAFPDFGIAEHFLLTKNILINQFSKSNLILSIKNGKIEGDYLLLKNKPDIKILNIDHKSAVLLEDTSNQKSVLFNGVHIIYGNPKIIGVFYLGLRFVQIGPREKSDLGPKHSYESLAEYHLRKETTEKTLTRLVSGDLIFPSFSIFYKIEPAGKEKMENTQFQGICKEVASGIFDLISTEKIDEFIVFQLLKKWNAFCENKSLHEILVESPDSFEFLFINEFGIRSRITLDQIFI